MRQYAKITDLTKMHSGKWYEVCIISTNDENEKPDIVGKFIYINDAIHFADYFNNAYAGFLEIIIR